MIAKTADVIGDMMSSDLLPGMSAWHTDSRGASENSCSEIHAYWMSWRRSTKGSIQSVLESTGTGWSGIHEMWQGNLAASHLCHQCIHSPQKWWVLSQRFDQSALSLLNQLLKQCECNGSKLVGTWDQIIPTGLPYQRSLTLSARANIFNTLHLFEYDSCYRSGLFPAQEESRNYCLVSCVFKHVSTPNSLASSCTKSEKDV